MPSYFLSTSLGCLRWAAVLPPKLVLALQSELLMLLIMMTHHRFVVSQLLQELSGLQLPSGVLPQLFALIARTPKSRPLSKNCCSSSSLSDRPRDVSPNLTSKNPLSSKISQHTQKQSKNKTKFTDYFSPTNFQSPTFKSIARAWDTDKIKQ